MYCSYIDCQSPPRVKGLCKKHYDKQRRPRIRTNDVARRKQYRLDNKERLTHEYKEWYYSENGQAYDRNRGLKRRYGITQSIYDQMLASQDGKCAICKTADLDRNTKYFHVDHDHKTGKIRGLLCRSCNTLLGCAKDSINILLSSVEYLKCQT